MFGDGLNNMHYLSIATIAQNEGKYLREFITYHLGVGVEHFYIYDNNNTPDTTREVCAEFGNKVDLFFWPGFKQQFPAMGHCLNTFRNQSRWISFQDVDEFLVPLNDQKLTEFLVPYEPHPALCVHWRFFGTSGNLKYSPEPVVERFTKCAKEIDRHIKAIVNPLRTTSLVTVHKWRHLGGEAVDEHFNIVPELESRPEPATADLIQMNHYVCKSIEECMERRSRPRADTGEMREFGSFIEAHDRNDAEDLRALELWKAMK